MINNSPILTNNNNNNNNITKSNLTLSPNFHKNINLQNSINQYQIQSIEFYNNEKYVECMKILNKLLELNQNDIIALCNRATCNYKLELYKHCIKDCDIVLYNEPNNRIALLRKSMALKQINNDINKIEINNLKKRANISWGYLSIKLEDDEFDDDDGDDDEFELNKPITTSSVFISSSPQQQQQQVVPPPPPQQQQIQQVQEVPQLQVLIEEEEEEQQQEEEEEEEEEEEIITQEEQMLIFQEKQQLFLQEQQEMIDDLLSSPPLSLSEMNNQLNSSGGINGNGNGTLMIKSESMEELNKLLDQLSTPENIATLISQGNQFVNSGKYEEAIELFTTVIDSNPLIPSAYLGRGTSNAILGELDDAIYDFSKAIELDNTNSDSYKRRAQSKVAKLMEYEALEDFNQAVAFDRDGDYDIYYNRGLLHYQIRNYERALKDFRKVVALEPNHKLAWNRIGLCLNVNGNPMDAIFTAFNESLKIDPSFEASYTNIGQCWKDLGNFDKSYQAFTKALEISPNYSNALHLRGLLFFNSGRHSDALKDWNLFLKHYGSATGGGTSMNGSNTSSSSSSSSSSEVNGIDTSIDVRQFRGIVNQSIGSFRKAIVDYDLILSVNPLHNVYYQKEIALWTHHQLNTPISTFNIDRSINCYLKTYQCQRLPHTTLMNAPRGGYKNQQPIVGTIQDIEISHQLNNDQFLLFKEAKRIGEMLQYNCDGFLANSRQKVQCGLAVIEIAQTLKRLWLSGNKSSSVFQLDGKSSSVTSGKHCFGWRDLYDIGVKWRQISEPNDPVWWIDQLSPEQFNEGFGSHTPIITGQCKVVRYYSMFEKSFEIMKLLLPIQHSDILSENYSSSSTSNNNSSSTSLLDCLGSATTCKDLYKLMKKDFYVVTPCYSRSNENKVMEGTRLTLQFIHPEGYEFAIRTPSTPTRWKDYDQELQIIWDQLVDKIFIYQNIMNKIDNGEIDDDDQVEKQKEIELLDEISELILSLTYYWYNFMPLSRGSAALGFTTMLGLFLSLDISINKPIPKNQQPDWEAILRPTSSSFISVIKPWLYPARQKFNLQTSSLVSTQFNTIKKMIQVLNNSNNC